MAAEAIYTVGPSSALTAEDFSEMLYLDAVHSRGLLAMGIQEGVLNEDLALTKNPGLTHNVYYNKRLTGKGVRGDSPKRSAAISRTFDKDSIVVNMLAQTVRVKTPGSVAQQSVPFNLRQGDFDELRDWFTDRMTFGMFNQIGGNSALTLSFDGDSYTGNDRLNITGLNSAIAPSTFRQKWENGNTTDQGVNADSSATLTLQIIDDLVQEARTQRSGVNNFKPLLGKPYNYIMFVSDAGKNQLLQQAVSSSILSLPEIAKNQLSGGQRDAVSGFAYTIYNETKIVAVPDHLMPNGVHSSTAAAQANVKRALFCGREAATLLFGQGYTRNNGDSVPGFELIEDDLDKIEKEQLISVQGIFGIKKAVIEDTAGTGYDQSVISVSHYVA